ncbi:3'-5' RNA exonuclease complex component [Gnomoniopsis sp. IMI 355080]|nr:3'-5' RNA exonuclease complex component [Gnomoniopsis sp. IMI 355080]
MSDPVALPSTHEHLTIRKRLKKWNEENQVEVPKPMPVDVGETGAPRNTGTRARVADESALERAPDDLTADQQFRDRDGSVDFFPPRSEFEAGDIFEYREEGDRSGIPIVAICLGYLNGFHHFYTANGLWVVAPGLKTHFIQRKFATEAEMQPVIEKLPKEKLSKAQMNEMGRKGLGPDRVTGAALLHKMNKFLEETDAVLQKYATRFEMAHQLVSEGEEKYLTLEQIKQRLLTEEDLKVPTPPHVLYAIHRTVFNDDVGFRIAGDLSKASSSEWLFEITAREDVSLIQNMQTLVRLFTDIPGRLSTSISSLSTSQLNQSQLGRFIVRARAAIDESRQVRDWTPYGILGPAKKQRSSSVQAWNNVDMSILHFMLLWAGYDQFSPSSRLHWIGSTILRATGKYKHVEYLSPSTAWTFLQEIGYITPWDLHERYTLRPPGAQISRQGGFVPFQLGPEGIRPYLTRDVFEGKRHDWASLKAFAIDSKSTTDVDDAVSVEATEAPDQHWIHIHVADPASRIRHQNALAQRASLTPMTLYLSGHYSNIWGVKDEVQKLFSLAPNRPCLTFSGLVNDEGELLEYKITPARLQEFVYMTPEDANAAADIKPMGISPESVDAGSFVVGETPQENQPTRHFTTPSELQPADLDSLKTLYRLAEARQQKRLNNGATPIWSQWPSVETSFDNTSIDHTPTGLMNCNGDPTMKISWKDDTSLMVSSLMVLAGEIAAQWSADRDIPVPYLSQPQAEKNRELLKTYTEKIYYPLLLKGEDTPDHFNQLLSLVGKSDVSTKPAPHFFMGVDMYTKVTSPLRRYSDLLAHWQIETALAHEMDAGKVMAAKLPFSRQDLDQEVLPWLRLRQQLVQRLIRKAGGQGYLTQALVRAWKYPVAGQCALPETFTFTVTLPEATGGPLAGRRKVIGGHLDWFKLKVWLVAEGLGKLGLSVADVRRGDVYKVKLKDVNVHLGEVYVEATEKVKVQKDQEIEQHETEAAVEEKRDH